MKPFIVDDEEKKIKFIHTLDDGNKNCLIIECDGKEKMDCISMTLAFHERNFYIAEKAFSFNMTSINDTKLKILSNIGEAVIFLSQVNLISPEATKKILQNISNVCTSATSSNDELHFSVVGSFCRILGNSIARTWQGRPSGTGDEVASTTAYHDNLSKKIL